MTHYGYHGWMLKPKGPNILKVLTWLPIGIFKKSQKSLSTYSSTVSKFIALFKGCINPVLQQLNIVIAKVTLCDTIF